MKTTTLDLVCGMDVDESTALSLKHDGTTYHFCRENCRQKFQYDPGEFIEYETETAEMPPKKTVAGSEKTRQKGRGTQWTDYAPLFVIVALTLLAAIAKQGAYPGGGTG